MESNISKSLYGHRREIRIGRFNFFCYWTCRATRTLQNRSSSLSAKIKAQLFIGDIMVFGLLLPPQTIVQPAAPLPTLDDLIIALFYPYRFHLWFPMIRIAVLQTHNAGFVSYWINKRELRYQRHFYRCESVPRNGASLFVVHLSKFSGGQEIIL